MDLDWQQQLAQAATEQLGYHPPLSGAQQSEQPTAADAAPAPIDRHKQPLRVRIEKKGRGGKVVTCINGWQGPAEGLSDLCHLLKTRCAVGGSVKDNSILLQGNLRDKVVKTLRDEGFTNAK